MMQILLVHAIEDQFAACYTDRSGNWHADLADSLKAAYRTLTLKIDDQANCYALTPSVYEEARAYFWEDQKEHGDFSGFRAERLSLLDELSWNCTQHTNKLRIADTRARLLARAAAFDEIERCK